VFSISREDVDAAGALDEGFVYNLALYALYLFVLLVYGNLVISHVVLSIERRLTVSTKKTSMMRFLVGL
jgi:hypothetical protein